MGTFDAQAQCDLIFFSGYWAYLARSAQNSLFRSVWSADLDIYLAQKTRIFSRYEIYRDQPFVFQKPFFLVQDFAVEIFGFDSH